MSFRGALGVPPADDWTSAGVFTLEQAVVPAHAGVAVPTVHVVTAARLLDTEAGLAAVEGRTVGAVLALADTAPAVTELVVQTVPGGLAGRGTDPEAAQHSTGTLLLIGTELELGTALGGFSSEARQTEAPGHVVGGPAVGVLAAHVEEAAHVDTLVPDTGPLPGTLHVTDALQLDTPDQGVAGGAGRAGAHGLVVGGGTDGVSSTGPGHVTRVLTLAVQTSGGLGTVVI